MTLLKSSIVGAFAAVLLMALAAATPALASIECSTCSPWWHLSSGSRPSVLKPGAEGEIVVTASNLGDTNVNGETSPVSIVDRLPAGLKAVSIEGTWGTSPRPIECSLAASKEEANCRLEGTFINQSGETLPKLVRPYSPIEVLIGVKVEPGAHSGEVNEASMSGGDAPAASLTRPLRIGEGQTSFGVEDYELTNEEVGGVPDTQAGSHPFQQTTTVVVNQTLEPELGGKLEPLPVALTKDLNFKWPPGLIGNPTSVPRCALALFLVQKQEGSTARSCPPQTAVGVATATLEDTRVGGHVTVLAVPLFNLEPSVGEPARFGFKPGNVPVYIDPSVRTGGDYGITVSTDNITQTFAFLSAQVTVWGVPGDPRHDSARGFGCLEVAEEAGHPLPCNPSEEQHPPPFLSLPTSCTGSSQSVVTGDSWASPAPSGAEPPQLASFTMPALDGCNRLPFSPEIRVTPDGTAASTPTGLNVDLHVPQEESLNGAGLAESDPKDITVALPQGVAVNPAGGDGLQACSEGLAGFTGLSELASLPGAQIATFTERLPSPLQSGANFCPDAAKIGTAKIKTPILPDPLEGSVYLATQNENPFGSLLALYLVAEDPVSGVLIKLAGETRLTESGQIVTTFKNSPQAPFEDAELHFFGGERAPLATPSRCGAYTTEASISPWSGNEPVSPSSTFSVVRGPNGTPCPGASLPFSPTLTGGTTNINAGSFSPLTTTIGRADGNQDMQSVQLHFPAGLSGLLSGVKLCPEAQANEGTCGPESQIGETTVSAGVGSDPVTVTGGRVYLTEKYAGAPFGLSIVNPVKAGPLDLEHDTSNPSNQPPCDCVVVRAKIEVDPHTAALTVTTDSSGPHSIPHLIDGIPVQIKKVNVLVNRAGFTFNPTTCSALSLTGTIASDEGASQPVSERFQATNCAVLEFAPKFAISTAGKTSKANGASLSVKLVYPKAPFGSQANIAKVKVDLPKQLPSRLTTLQKACTAAQFEANPAGCPAASLIGHAKAITPLIPVPLEGPAYFVSHGGEAFPSLILVLQGYGVTVDLVGTTFISKAGITSSTFKTVPDAPVGSFELILPQGRFSALAANVDLCKSKLAAPTEFVAQNGATIHQSTKIAVTGCAKLTRKQKLAAALKACRRKSKRQSRQRTSCDRAAHRRYGPLKVKKKK